MRKRTAPQLGCGPVTAKTITAVESSVTDRTTDTTQPSCSRSGARICRAEQLFLSWAPVASISHGVIPAELRRQLARRAIDVPPSAITGNRPGTMGDLARVCGITRARSRQLLRLSFPGRRLPRRLSLARTGPRAHMRRPGREPHHGTRRRRCRRNHRRGPPGQDEPAGQPPTAGRAAPRRYPRFGFCEIEAGERSKAAA
jgi:hypothetical protein